MELKNAVAVCLISLFSATLVVLIARSMDSQAAARLEPQLAKIVAELEAIRNAGGLTTGTGVASTSESVDDAVMVYYLHGSMRCPTCKGIQSQAQETVESAFASELESGEVAWKVVNYEKPEGTDLGKKFEVQMPVVVVAKMNNGQIEDWKRLDEVWALVNNESAFSQYIRDEISQMLGEGAQQPTSAVLSRETPDLPVPAIDTSDLPVPAVGGELNVLPAGGGEELLQPDAAEASDNVLRVPAAGGTNVSDD